MSLERRTAAAWAIHPGEILKQEFLNPLGMSQYKLAQSIGVPAQAINDIVRRKRGISTDVALRLGKFWGTTPEFWLNLQIAYDLHVSRKQAKFKLEKIRPYKAA